MAIRMTAGVFWLASATAIVIAQGEHEAAPTGSRPPVVRAVLSSFLYPTAFPLRSAATPCRP
jgi:hypothetical protein